MGIQLSLPLFDGGVTLQRIDQKKIELQSTELQINLASEQSRLQIENAKQQRIQAKKMVDSTLTQIEIAQTIFNQAQLQQKQGTASLTDILLADNSLRETQQNYLSRSLTILRLIWK
jgi:OMF family outer membrane factor